jgi:hypothetical protein
MITSPIKFLGAYVVNASCSLGWGGETSTCSLTLVEDPANGITFLPANPKSKIRNGTPCLFQIGSKFEFGGILQRWTYSESVSEGRKYEVVLESPSKVLDGVYVILDKFQGTIYTSDDINNVSTQATSSGIMTYGGTYPTNIINVFGSKENTQASGIFGGSKIDGFGYPISGIVSDISGAINNSFTLPTIKGVDKFKFGGKIAYGDGEYDLDLSELDKIIPSIKDWRISGDFMTVNQLIKDIADVALADFVYTITGTTDPKTGIIIKNAKIKVLVVSRKEPPTPNAINALITEIKNKPDAEKNLISYNTGKELSDSTTQKVLIGGPASRYWFSSAKNYDILPVWGMSGQGALATYIYGKSLAEYEDYATKIKVRIDGGYTNNFSEIETDLLEIRCALSGRETWNLYHIFNAIKANIISNNVGYQKITFGNVNFTLKEYLQLIEGKAVTNDLMDTSMESGEAMATFILGKEYQKAFIQQSIDSRFQSMQKTASQFYGKTFMVSLPGEAGGLNNNIKYLYNGIETVNAWDIASSSWSSANLRFYFKDPKFYDEDGRFSAIAIYDNLQDADYSSLGNNYSVNTIGVCTDISIEKDIRWLELTLKDSVTEKDVQITKGLAIANIDSPIYYYDKYTTQTNGFNILAELIFGRKFPTGYQNLFGSAEIDVPIHPAPLLPKNIGVPQQSNRYVWGPWFSFNSTSGKQGKVEILEETNFSPETFGSIDAMNQAAKTIVNSEMSQVYENESGFIELAEEPQFNLASRFLNTGPYITTININIGAEGIKTTYQFNSWTKTYGRIAKYNIDRISKLQKGTFSFYKKLRELFINPPVRPFNTAILGYIEKLNKKTQPKYETQGIFGNFVGLLSQNINNQNITSNSSSNEITRTPLSYSPLVETNPNNISESSNTPRLIIGASNMSAAMKNTGANYDEGFGCSMEQIFSPVVSFKQDNTESGLSPYPKRPVDTTIFGDYNIDPTSIYPSFEISKKYVLSRSGLYYNRHVSPPSYNLDPYFFFSSNDFSCVLKDDRARTTDINLNKDPAKYYVKTMGLRGPLMLSGWGFDSAGLPVPWSGGKQIAGQVSTAQDPWRFASGVATDRTLWKTGPVDLRWHKERKVWVGGPDFLEGVLITDLNFADTDTVASGKMQIVRSKGRDENNYNAPHLETKDEFVVLYNRDISFSAASGSYVIAMEINYEWRPIWSQCNPVANNTNPPID